MKRALFFICIMASAIGFLRANDQEGMTSKFDVIGDTTAWPVFIGSETKKLVVSSSGHDMDRRVLVLHSTSYFRIIMSSFSYVNRDINGNPLGMPLSTGTVNGQMWEWRYEGHSPIWGIMEAGSGINAFYPVEMKR